MFLCFFHGIFFTVFCYLCLCVVLFLLLVTWLFPEHDNKQELVKKFKLIDLPVSIIALPIPVTARSKAWVCGRSVAGIVGSNPSGYVDVYPL